MLNLIDDIPDGSSGRGDDDVKLPILQSSAGSNCELAWHKFLKQVVPDGHCVQGGPGMYGDPLLKNGVR